MYSFNIGLKLIIRKLKHAFYNSCNYFIKGEFSASILDLVVVYINIGNYE